VSALPIQPGLLPLALIDLTIGGLAVCCSLELALRFVPQERARLRWALAVTGFALAIAVPLALVAAGLPASASTVGLAEPGSPPELLVVEPVATPTAWLSWLVVGWPAWSVGVIWLAGCAMLGLRTAALSYRLGRLARGWREAPGELRRLLGWPEDFALRVGETGMPIALGRGGGTAFLPLWLLSELDPAAVRAVARHELAHLRWRDPTVAAAVRALRCLFWPVVPLWSLERRVRRECEAAADAEAVAETTNAIAYVEALAGVARRRRGSALALGAVGELEERARRLLLPERRSGRLRILAAFLLPAAGAIALHLSPLATWRQAAFDERAGWGPLDYALGFNPVIETAGSGGGESVWIQDLELSPPERRRWLGTLSLAERAEMVRAVERRSRADRAAAAPGRDGP
jgi:beta-lactamase regulating signal transducer with metallopeptidase domain